MKFENRRRWVREVLSGTCSFTVEGTTYKGKLRDISVGGCFVSLEYSHNIDLNVPCEITITTIYGSFDVMGRVVREGDGGYGLFFNSIDNESKIVFHEIIKALRQSEL